MAWHLMIVVTGESITLHKNLGGLSENWGGVEPLSWRRHWLTDLNVLIYNLSLICAVLLLERWIYITLDILYAVFL